MSGLLNFFECSSQPMRRASCIAAVRVTPRAVQAPRRGFSITRSIPLRPQHTLKPSSRGTAVRNTVARRSHTPVVCVSQSFFTPTRVVPSRYYATYPPHSLAGMPSLSPTMTVGTISSWKKNEGDKVKAGDVIAEIETDKASVAFEYQDDAYLAKILYPKGASDIPVGVPIAVLVDKAEDVPKFKDFKPEPVKKAPAAAAAAAAAPSPAPAAAPSPPPPAAAPPPPAAAAQAPAAHGDRVIASPLAKSIARESGVDLRGLAGTGPGGRIIAADVAAAKSQPRAAQPVSAAPAQAAAGAVVGDYTDLPLSNIRKVIATRLSQSKQTIPHYYLSIDARVDKLQKLRAELNGKGDKDVGYKLSVNDFVIKAAALACKKVPEANSSWNENAIRRYHNVHVNVAVATDQGLLTPLVRDADRSGLASISNSVRRLAEKAKAGKLTPTDLEIGTFTISNLGMFGIKNFSAVILPPQACILAVGSAEKRLIPGDAPAKGDELPISTATIMNFTLSCDHRVVDGAVGAEWLKAFKELIEDPTKMLL